MRHSFIESMKEIFRDWDLKVMSYVMLVVTATCVITATVAWFTSYATTYVKAMEMKTASAELIKLAVEEGGEDVDVLREQGENPEAVIEMPVFSNVMQSENKVLAPGVHGSITLYVTAMKPEVTGCLILPSYFGSQGDKEGLTYMDGVTDEEKAVIEKLVQGHILFFENYDEATGTFSGQLTEKKPLSRKLSWDKTTSQGIEEEITIYWYWPYEYGDMPEEVSAKLSRDMLFDPERDAENQYTDSRLYDYADTKIGTYVKNIKVHFEVSAKDEEGNS